jgi:hypothetical protein
MERVKKNPLDQVLAHTLRSHDFVVQMVGVRSEESARVKRYAEGLPFGLTQLAGPEGHRRVGATPIVHWSDEALQTWMTKALAPYDLQSLDALQAIYRLGSSKKELAGQCAIRVTQEGAVTSVCQDLSGARFGCVYCLLSKNRSLQHASRKNPRYAWLRKFHAYLYGHHRRSDLRRRRRDALGLNGRGGIPIPPQGIAMKARGRSAE